MRRSPTWSRRRGESHHSTERFGRSQDGASRPWHETAPAGTTRAPDSEQHRLVGGDPNIVFQLGYWSLAPDEALLVEAQPPRCEYWNFQLTNIWAECLDKRRLISRNIETTSYEPDGSFRLLVAHRVRDSPTGSTRVPIATASWACAGSEPTRSPPRRRRSCRVPQRPRRDCPRRLRLIWRRACLPGDSGTRTVDHTARSRSRHPERGAQPRPRRVPRLRDRWRARDPVLPHAHRLERDVAHLPRHLLEGDDAHRSRCRDRVRCTERPWVRRSTRRHRFGCFVDELGTFITRKVNDFFSLTLALIPVVFIALYLGVKMSAP